MDADGDFVTGSPVFQIALLVLLCTFTVVHSSSSGCHDVTPGRSAPQGDKKVTE